MLAAAILASLGSKERQEQQKLIRTALEFTPSTEKNSAKTEKDWSEEKKAYDQQWCVLRALRFVYLPFTVPIVCKLIERGEDNNVTYDAIVALGNVQPKTPQAEDAAHTLEGFITKSRRYQAWEVMRIRAINALGRLGVERTSTLLLEELIDFNPAVAKAAAESLEMVLGPSTTVARVMETLIKQQGLDIVRYARGLREMQNQKAIADQLGTSLFSTTDEAQGYAQQLLSAIGGAAAFEKLRNLTKSNEHYLAALKSADESLSDLFNKTIKEAQMGFRVVIGMDVIVFAIGVALIAASAFLALQDSSPNASWSSWITGSGGVLAVIYGRFVAKPREQVEQSVQYLSGLKAVFLGYLRQLRQTDQAYTRRVLEDEKLGAAETKEFNKLVDEIMENSVKRLTAKPSASSENEPQTTAAATKKGLPAAALIASTANPPGK